MDFSPDLNALEGIDDGPGLNALSQKEVGQREETKWQLCIPHSSPAPTPVTNPEAPNSGGHSYCFACLCNWASCLYPMKTCRGEDSQKSRGRCYKSSPMGPCLTAQPRGWGFSTVGCLHTTLSGVSFLPKGGNKNSCYQFQTTHQGPDTMLNALVAISP